jgi:parallel beta-helix repeat protein
MSKSYAAILLASFALLMVIGCQDNRTPMDATAFPEGPLLSGAGNVLQVPAEYSTIQAAVDAANDGDIIQVAAGDYAGALVAKPLSIIGAGADTRITDSEIFVNGYKTGINIDAWYGVKVSNLSFINLDVGIYVPAGYKQTGIQIENCRIEQASYTGIRAWNNSELSIRNCTLVGDGGYIAIWVGASSGVQIIGNTVTGQNNVGIWLSSVQESSVERNDLSGHYALWGQNALVLSNGNSIKNNSYGPAGMWGLVCNTSNDNSLVNDNFLGEYSSVVPCVWLAASSNNRVVSLKNGKVINGITICTKFFDDSDDPATPEYDGLNDIPGIERCENMPLEHLQDVKQMIEARLEEMASNIPEN